MVSSLQFEENVIRLKSRYVRSRKFQEEQNAGQPRFRAFGTSFPGDQLNRARNGLESPVNVSIYPLERCLLAFGEQGLPWELDPVTLETRGQFTFGGRLNDASRRRKKTPASLAGAPARGRARRAPRGLNTAGFASPSSIGREADRFTRARRTQSRSPGALPVRSGRSYSASIIHSPQLLMRKRCRTWRMARPDGRGRSASLQGPRPRTRRCRALGMGAPRLDHPGLNR